MRLLLFVLVFVIIGCGPTVVYECSKDVGEAWSYEEELSFDFDVSDTSMVYQLEFMVEHSTYFPYQNLYVNVGTTYPDGHTVRDAVSLAVTDKRGQYYGKCSGTSCTLPILLHENFKFQQIGKHQISIAQHSRKEDLTDVFGGTLRLVEVDQK